MSDGPKNQEPNEPLIPNHEADGIRELDNLLPRWWVWLFYLTTIFAIGYMGYYHVLKAGDLQVAEYNKEQKIGEAIKGAALAKFETGLGALEPSKDPVILAEGRQMFGNMSLSQITSLTKEARARVMEQTSAKSQTSQIAALMQQG